MSIVGLADYNETAAEAARRIVVAGDATPAVTVLPLGIAHLGERKHAEAATASEHQQWAIGDSPAPGVTTDCNR